MPRVSAKTQVKKLRPEAEAERHRTNGGRVYWLIRMGREFMWFADGETEAAAWKKALDTLKAAEAAPGEGGGV